MNNFGFEVALKKLKEGKAVAREAWGDFGKPEAKYILLMGESYEQTLNITLSSFLAIIYPIRSKYKDGLISPWTPTRCDLLEEDWYEI